MSIRKSYWYNVGFHNRKAKACMRCQEYHDDEQCPRPYKWMPVEKGLDEWDIDAYNRGYSRKDFKKNMECW